MPGKRKLIVVANRGPVGYGRSDGGERITKRGGGGLVTALRSLVTQHDVTWIGSAMSDEDRAVAAEHGGDAFDETFHDGSPYRLRLVTHDAAAYDGFYNVVANPTLWFIQHYMWGLANEPDLDAAFHAAWSGGYVAGERGVRGGRRRPSSSASRGDGVLPRLPPLSRAGARPRAASERADDALHPHPVAGHGLLVGSAADSVPRFTRVCLRTTSVGLHTNRWRLNFLRSCADILGAEVDSEASTVVHRGRRTLVTSHPISIETASSPRLRDDARVLDEERLIEERRPESLVVRVDRTDPSKNIVRGFRAFALFLEQHPEMARPRHVPRAARPVAAGRPRVCGLPRCDRA